MRFPDLRIALGTLIAAGALALAGPAASASAHDGLESSDPAADSSITTDPGAITLGYSDDLLALGSSTGGFALQVIDSEGLHYESGCVGLAGAQLSAPIALGDAGGYVVLWQVVSSDGHPTSGQYDFDYEPVSADGAAEGLTDAPVCGEAWAGAPDGTTPAPTPVASPSASAGLPTATADASAGADAPVSATQTAVPVTDDASSLPWPVVVLIVIAGLGALAAIVLLVIRRGRSGGYGQG
ncbi:copper resistance protein CopC [Herbiconiux sp. YIM B11900]|uniref:copper resistance CopC family protein n=1 Tax=Herbiconiux sp. YIM B11900 TaxID=3404131 RepID=UPI003F84908F